MRMPEPDKGHYENESLNHGYVYTNLSDIAIREDIAKDYVTIYSSRRIDDYEPIELVSVPPQKTTRKDAPLAALYSFVFGRSEEVRFGKRKSKPKGKKVQIGFISDYEAESVDELGGVDIVAERSVDTDNEYDLQKLYDFFVRQRLTPFYPEDRSIGRVKEAIYYFFHMRLGFSLYGTI